MKRKIHIDRTLPDKASVARHKDFDGLLKKHQALTRRPRYNGIKVITGIMVIAVLAVLVFEADREEQRAVRPPLGEEMIDYQYHVVDPEEGGRIQLISGTTITIEPGSLVDEDGEELSELVLFKVSEFRNPLEYFLSGIPMTYDSGGVEYTFQSAGMIRLEAHYPKGIAQLKEGKTARISTLSSQEERFNVYRFDTVSNAWQLDVPAQVTALSQGDGAAGSPVSLDLPGRYDSTKYSFDFEFDSSDFPQLAPFRDVFFEIDDASFDTALFDVLWDSAALSRKARGSYNVSLFLTEDEKVLEAVPVVETANYDSVVAVYEAKMDAYEAIQQEQREQQLQEARARVVALEKQRIAARKELLQQYKQRDIEERQRRRELKSIQQKQDSIQRAYQALVGQEAYGYTVRRDYQVTTFGIWNCDRPLPEPKGALFALHFKDEQGAVVERNAMLQHADLRKNALFTYVESTSQIKAWPSGEHVLWFVVDKERLAWVTPEAFESAAAREQPFTVQMEPHEQAVARLRELMAAMRT